MPNAPLNPLLEVADVIASLASALVDAESNGSIDWRDIPKFAPVLASAKVALGDGKDIPAAIKAALSNGADLEMILNKFFEAAAALAAAVVNAPKK